LKLNSWQVYDFLTRHLWISFEKELSLMISLILNLYNIDNGTSVSIKCCSASRILETDFDCKQNACFKFEDINRVHSDFLLGLVGPAMRSRALKQGVCVSLSHTLYCIRMRIGSPSDLWPWASSVQGAGR